MYGLFQLNGAHLPPQYNLHSGCVVLSLRPTKSIPILRAHTIKSFRTEAYKSIAQYLLMACFGYGYIAMAK